MAPVQITPRSAAGELADAELTLAQLLERWHELSSVHADQLARRRRLANQIRHRMNGAIGGLERSIADLERCVNA